MANADAINVDIPNRDELEAIVQRLEAAGLIHAKQERVHPTRVGRLLVRRSSPRFAGIRDITPHIEAALNERLPVPTQGSQWTLSAEAWQDAYQRYAGE